MKSAFFSLPRTRMKRGKDEGPRDGVGNQRTPRSCAPRLYSSRRVSSLLAHARKQEISLPVACLLVLMRSASQLFKAACPPESQRRPPAPLGAVLHFAGRGLSPASRDTLE